MVFCRLALTAERNGNPSPVLAAPTKEGMVVETWIFQGNPDRFKIAAYLSASAGQITWLVTRYARKISPGDTVYIWVAQGKRGTTDTTGIVAEAEVLDRPTPRRDPDGARFWIDPAEANELAIRVRLRLKRVATKPEIIKRHWLKDDSVLSDLSVLRLQIGTNFAVSPKQASRLADLWTKTGRDWTRAEVIAALHLYEQLLHKPISRSIGSSIEKTAQLIGRAPSGVYNKLMNLRSLDPRIAAAGLPSVATMDRVIWGHYFDPMESTMNIEALTEDFRPAPGSADTELGVLMGLEGGHGETEVYPGVQA